MSGYHLEDIDERDGPVKIRFISADLSLTLDPNVHSALFTWPQVTPRVSGMHESSETSI